MMRLYFSTCAPRRQPRAGDRRTTKKHGLQIRVLKLVRDTRGRYIGLGFTGGRQHYEWRTLAELDPSDHYLLTKEERAALVK